MKFCKTIVGSIRLSGLHLTTSTCDHNLSWLAITPVTGRFRGEVGVQNKNQWACPVFTFTLVAENLCHANVQSRLWQDNDSFYQPAFAIFIINNLKSSLLWKIYQIKHFKSNLSVDVSPVCVCPPLWFPDRKWKFSADLYIDAGKQFLEVTWHNRK